MMHELFLMRNLEQATLREKLSTAQSDILENRRQFNLRKHYDSEVERWIDQLKRDMDEYESVLGHARDAIERQQGTDKILMERLLHIEDIKNDYKEAVRACQEAKVAAEEKFAQQNLNVSSLPVHERIAPEPWSDDESSEVSPIMKRTKQFSRNCSSAISSTLTKRVTVGSVIAPVLLLSTLVSVGIAVSSYDISTLANSSGLTTTCAVMEGVFGGVGTRDVEQSRKPGDTTFWGHVDKSFARLEQVVSGVKDNEIEVLPM
ncbi:hypothetical protein BC830DRAFT_636527 [Chytriomyces sp. MP71]|nr:hypothetical protein BC830DRAFT_636527 [Chytriomyces sp. MP71]